MKAKKVYEFEKSDDINKSLDIGENRSGTVPSELREMGFTHWDKEEHCYLDAVPGGSDHTMVYGNWDWENGWDDDYLYNDYLRFGDLNLMIGDGPRQGKRGPTTRGYDIYWDAISIEQMQEMDIKNIYWKLEQIRHSDEIEGVAEYLKQLEPKPENASYREKDINLE